MITSTSFSQSDKQQLHTAPDGWSRYPGEQLQAKNASSNFYRFLCYYKILEGLLNRMRAAVYNDAKARGLNIMASKLLIPAHPNDGGTLDMSEPGHLDRYAGVILVSEVCVRAAIADHERLLEQIR